MGFDYKNVDADQLKTVSSNSQFRRQNMMPFKPLVVPSSTTNPRRFTSHIPSQVSKNQAEAIQVQTTLTIKEQQEALIAQRRRDAELDASEPKQLEFRNWQPPAAGDRTKSSRRPPGQATPAHMTVNIARGEDVMSGIRVSLM
jgi:hypothetical protein